MVLRVARMASWVLEELGEGSLSATLAAVSWLLTKEAVAPLSKALAAEEVDEIVEAVACCARTTLHHLILKVFLLFNLQEPHHHQLRLASGDRVDAGEVPNRFLCESKLSGEGVDGVEGEWRAAGQLERHGVQDDHGSRAFLDCFKKTPRLNLVQP